MAQHATRSRSSTTVLLRCLLALALLAPSGVLFVQLWTSVGDRLAVARLERQGLEYLNRLGQLTIAMTDAQSAAIAGQPFPRDAITRAVEAVGSVDTSIGGELRTHERWSALRAKVEALASMSITDPTSAYATYSEATDLLLALYEKVRDNSQLIRDQDADAYYLQDGAAQELPEAVVAAGRFADLAVMAVGRPRSDAATTTANLLNARDAVISPANDLAADLQAAVDGTSSRTLSSNLLSRLDRFRRSMDTLTATTVPVDGRTPVDVGALQRVRAEVQASASELATAILAELDGLISARIDNLDRQRLIAAGTLAAAGLLALIPVGALFGRPRRRPDAEPPTPPTPPYAAGDGRPLDGLEPAVELSRREPTGAR
ncbi:hypothetical protein KZZ52_26825 [Dactylosporangium sp. AC04546]|uniref:hypothetical protein n=1 Tax=Dactylosporangium sp. AC04546 TaxID=2862460 RepID=UPI001EDEBAA6|nr:hypothetical protein [Dactylosporangium sp. AC04546]WVK88883.1 hypothetical protein KZZ52_26825 [Dactylosporangium sp. AC04546]